MSESATETAPITGLVPMIHVADAHDVLFYLYAEDLKSLRSRLLAEGVNAGEISHPDYLPAGEFRVQDPDGYTLMIAQSAPDTP